MNCKLEQKNHSARLEVVDCKLSVLDTIFIFELEAIIIADAIKKKCQFYHVDYSKLNGIT